MSEQELVEIGRIGKAHGIRGELGVELNAENPKLLSGHIFLRMAAPDRSPSPAGSTGRQAAAGQGSGTGHGKDQRKGQPSARQISTSRRAAKTATLPRKYKVTSLRMHKERPLLTLEGISDRTAAELLRNAVILVPIERLPELAPDEIFMRELPGLDIYVDVDDADGFMLDLPDSEDAPDATGGADAADGAGTTGATNATDNANATAAKKSANTTADANNADSANYVDDADSADDEDEGEELPLLGKLESVAEIAGQEIWTIVTPDGKEVLLPANEEFVSEINLEEGYAVITPPPGLLELYLG